MSPGWTDRLAGRDARLAGCRSCPGCPGVGGDGAAGARGAGDEVLPRGGVRRHRVPAGAGLAAAPRRGSARPAASTRHWRRSTWRCPTSAVWAGPGWSRPTRCGPATGPRIRAAWRPRPPRWAAAATASVPQVGRVVEQAQRRRCRPRSRSRRTARRRTAPSGTAASGGAPSARRTQDLDRGDVGDQQDRPARGARSAARRGRRAPGAVTVVKLSPPPVGRVSADVSQASRSLGVALHHLGEGQPLPGAEVGLAQPSSTSTAQPEPVRDGLRGLPAAGQR